MLNRIEDIEFFSWVALKIYGRLFICIQANIIAYQNISRDKHSGEYNFMEYNCRVNAP